MDTKAPGNPTTLSKMHVEQVSGGMLAIYSAVNSALFQSASQETMHRHIKALENCEEGGACP